MAEELLEPPPPKVRGTGQQYGGCSPSPTCTLQARTKAVSRPHHPLIALAATGHRKMLQFKEKLAYKKATARTLTDAAGSLSGRKGLADMVHAPFSNAQTGTGFSHRNWPIVSVSPRSLAHTSPSHATKAAIGHPRLALMTATSLHVKVTQVPSTPKHCRVILLQLQMAC